jgi:hypothetical protein
MADEAVLNKVHKKMPKNPLVNTSELSDKAPSTTFPTWIKIPVPQHITTLLPLCNRPFNTVSTYITIEQLLKQNHV